MTGAPARTVFWAVAVAVPSETDSVKLVVVDPGCNGLAIGVNCNALSACVSAAGLFATKRVLPESGGFSERNARYGLRQ